jgi:predicted DsbA family dithiol-disulfide isomerase
LEREIIDVLAELKLEAEVEHVRDIKEIGKYGVTGVPALIINGEVKSVGSVPARAKLIEWLKEAKKSKQ